MHCVERGSIQQSVFSLVTGFNSMVAPKVITHTKVKPQALRKYTPNPKNATIRKTHTKVRTQTLRKMRFKSKSVINTKTVNVLLTEPS